MQSTNNARPASVTRAIGCLWAALALSAIASGISIGREAYIGQASGGIALATLVLLAVVGFYSALVYMLALGRNWARMTWVVLFAIGIGEYVFVAVVHPDLLLAAVAAAPVQYSLCTIAACLTACASWLVFRAPGKSWFKPMHAQS